jgi:hypothetical protein
MLRCQEAKYKSRHAHVRSTSAFVPLSLAVFSVSRRPRDQALGGNVVPACLAHPRCGGRPEPEVVTQDRRSVPMNGLAASLALQCCQQSAHRDCERQKDCGQQFRDAFGHHRRQQGDRYGDREKSQYASRSCLRSRLHPPQHGVVATSIGFQPRDCAITRATWIASRDAPSLIWWRQEVPSAMRRVSGEAARMAGRRESSAIWSEVSRCSAS